LHIIWFTNTLGYTQNQFKRKFSVFAHSLALSSCVPSRLEDLFLFVSHLQCKFVYFIFWIFVLVQNGKFMGGWALFFLLLLLLRRCLICICSIGECVCGCVDATNLHNGDNIIDVCNTGNNAIFYNNEVCSWCDEKLRSTTIVLTIHAQIFWCAKLKTYDTHKHTPSERECNIIDYVNCYTKTAITPISQ
jgi:hypothetical protein